LVRNVECLTAQAVAKRFPFGPGELMRVTVGWQPGQFDKYGDEVLEVVRAYMNRNNRLYTHEMPLTAALAGRAAPTAALKPAALSHAGACACALC
jgi:hypothetical protein